MKRAKRSSRCNPVTFRYKKELDPESIPQFGLVAEEVEKVNPDFGRARRGWKSLHRALRSGERDVAQRVHQRAPQGRNKRHPLKSTAATQEATVAELKDTVAQQQREMQAFAAYLKEQDSKIQKVSDQVEASKPAPQMVLNNQ